MINSLIYIIIFFSLLVALLNNAANALFALAGCYFISAVLFLVLHLEFLALILIIVYIGALLMLFIFILLLSNLKEFYKNSFKFSSQIFSFYIIFSIIFYLFKIIKFSSLSMFQIIYNFENFYIFYSFFESDLDCFIFLYTDFFIWFFLITLILFISIIGSLFLLTNKKFI